MRDRILWVGWRTVIAFGLNALPLLLILNGTMETADLLLAYLIQTGVGLVALAVLARRDRQIRRRLGDRTVVGLAVFIALLWILLARRVGGSVDWTLGRTSLAVLTGLFLAGGTAWVLRDDRTKRPVGPVLRTVSWQLFVLVIGVFAGLNAAESYPVLVSHGWTPSHVGPAWSFPFGTLFGRLAETFDVHPAVWPAIMIVSLTTINETLLTLRRTLGSEVGEISPGLS